MKKELTIIIAGQCGTGKSTIALLLEKFLQEQGFNVEFDLSNELRDYSDEEHFRELMNLNLRNRLEAFKSDLKITLKQIQMKSEEKISKI
jgi:ABC-type bacteriocin/lantibiotic exporter with double-glycine peptidase domain